MQKYPLHIVSISQYGSGLSQVGAQFSGALGRQRDYMEAIERYSVIVPSETGSEEPIDHGDGLVVYPVVSKNIIHFFFRAYRRVLQIHRERAAHAVMVDNPHVIGLLGLVLTWKTGAVLVVHSMSDMIGNPWYARERFSNRIKALFIRLSVAVADLIRVSTAHEVARVRALGVADSKVVRVPFYIDRDIFEQRITGVSAVEDPNMVLYVGRLGAQKDLGVLLKAMAIVRTSHPEAKLMMVGDGPDRAMLQNLARTLGIEQAVVFAGKIPYEQVVTYFKSARLFAISSLHEGTCMVLHEAAVAKKPLVATAFAGAVDFIRDGVEGYIVPIRDHRALAEKIGMVLDDPAKAGAMGEAAYHRMDAFTRDEALQGWHALVSRIMNLQHDRQGRP